MWKEVLQEDRLRWRQEEEVMQEGQIKTYAYAYNGKVRLHVVDDNNSVEMEADTIIAQHLIDSLSIAIKKAKDEKFDEV